MCALPTVAGPHHHRHIRVYKILLKWNDVILFQNHLRGTSHIYHLSRSCTVVTIIRMLRARLRARCACAHVRTSWRRVTSANYTPHILTASAQRTRTRAERTRRVLNLFINWMSECARVRMRVYVDTESVLVYECTCLQRADRRALGTEPTETHAHKHTRISLRRNEWMFRNQETTTAAVRQVGLRYTQDNTHVVIRICFSEPAHAHFSLRNRARFGRFLEMNFVGSVVLKC